MAQDLSNHIQSAYKEYLLEQGHAPTSIFKFCKNLGVSERDFYTHFSSLEQIHQVFWSDIIVNVQKSIEKEEVWESYGDREKHLAFLFSFLDQLLDHRSFLDLSFPSDHNPMLRFKILRVGMDDILKKWVPDGPDLPPPFESIFRELAWYQCSFILDYWLKDRSKGFEKTDALIEKSSHWLYNIYETSIVQSSIDLLKFLGEDRSFFSSISPKSDLNNFFDKCKAKWF
jgi:AcrR family transcriptional regulator